MNKFIGYTVGLECWAREKLTLVKIEYSKGKNESVRLNAVSGHNLSSIAPKLSKVIPADTFAARPVDPYDSTVEAVWALQQLGLRPAALPVD